MRHSNSEAILHKIRQKLVTQIWKGVALLSVIAVPASLLRSIQTGWLPVHSFHVVAGIFVVTVYLLQPRLSFKAKTGLLLGLFISIGCIGLLSLGLLGAGVWWLVVSNLLFYALFSRRSGIISVVGTMAFTCICGLLYVGGIIKLPIDANLYIVSFTSWISLLVAITLMPFVVFQALSIYRDSTVQLINKIEAQRAEILHVAMHDQLTDLATLNLTEDRFEVASSLAVRAQKKVALLFIDLDGFKNVNDIHGHEAGDAVLVEVARRLKSLCRSEDTASRAGGDEFILLLSNLEASDVACDTARRVIASLQEPILFNEETLQTGASVGISIFPDHAKSLISLKRKADSAMYQIKQCGKNNYQLYTPPESGSPEDTLI